MRKKKGKQKTFLYRLRNQKKYLGIDKGVSKKVIMEKERATVRRMIFLEVIILVSSICWIERSLLYAIGYLSSKKELVYLRFFLYRKMQNRLLNY